VFQSGGAQFALTGSPIARDVFVAEAGLDLALNTNASLASRGAASSPNV